jgi:hypothetical protein
MESFMEFIKVGSVIGIVLWSIGGFLLACSETDDDSWPLSRDKPYWLLRSILMGLFFGPILWVTGALFGLSYLVLLPMCYLYNQIKGD